MHAELGPLDQVVGYQLKRTEAILRSAMEDQLRPLGLSVPQYAILELLAQQPGISVSDLARAAFVTRQATHGVLVGLERQGLVERDPSPETGRALPARLTETGAQLHHEASQAIAQVEERSTRGLTLRQQHQLLDHLEHIARNLTP